MGMTEPTWKKWLRHPASPFVIGLVAFPLAKLAYIPNYVFNFLTTLVHEIGHSLCAWLMGMPSLPTVGIFGGGVAVWTDQIILIPLAIIGALVALAIRFRDRLPVMISILCVIPVYALLAFTNGKNLFATAGGILLEIVGASACFYVVLVVSLERPFERPLYALWGWWMLLNRMAETVLMLKSPQYFQRQAVIDSGLAAGLTSDLEILREHMAVGSPAPILWCVLILCLLALPGAILAAWIRNRLVESKPI
jgi:hypothetical protein